MKLQWHLHILEKQKWMMTGNLSAITGDIVWVVYDISKNGLHISYATIAVLFAVALACNLRAALIYHREELHKFRKELLARKIVENKKLHRIHKKLNEHVKCKESVKKGK